MSKLSAHYRVAFFLISFNVLVSGVIVSCADDRAETVQLRINSHTFYVEVAMTDEERARGLMHRDSIPETGGMLFVFESERRLSFWMKDTRIPLSIAFIRDDGLIMEMYDMEPFSLETIESRFPARYALEVNKGTFGDLGIRPGDRVQIPEEF